MSNGISICIITYNQEKYIGQAIESALMQMGDFRYEIIISDDCSTDNTPAIIRSYFEKYPEVIKASFSEKNLGMLRNWEKALKLCKKEYIALLEGDDFWTDPFKLQKQLNVLNENLDCVVSFTNANIKYESGEPGYPIYVTIPEGIYGAADLLDNNFIPTCSVLMRNHISDVFFHPAYFNSPFADWVIHILNSRFGNFHFLNEFTSTYRVHVEGVWSKSSSEKQLLDKLKCIDCIDQITKNTALSKGTRESRKRILQNLCQYFKTRKMYWKHFFYRMKLVIN